MDKFTFMALLKEYPNPSVSMLELMRIIVKSHLGNDGSEVSWKVFYQALEYVGKDSEFWSFFDDGVFRIGLTARKYEMGIMS